MVGAGNIKPGKRKSIERIDRIVAAIMALDRAQVVQVPLRHRLHALGAGAPAIAGDQELAFDLDAHLAATRDCQAGHGSARGRMVQPPTASAFTRRGMDAPAGIVY